MEFKKHAVKSWSAIVPIIQGEGGEKRYHLSSKDNLQLINLNLNVAKRIKIHFSIDSLLRYEKLFYSYSFFKYLNDNYLYQPSGSSTFTINEKYNEFTIENFKELKNISALIDAEITIDPGNRVFLKSTNFLSKLSFICPGNDLANAISGIILKKGAAKDVYNLEIYFDENIFEKYSIKCNQVEEEKRVEIPSWVEICRLNTMPDFVFEVFKYLNEKDDLAEIQKLLVTHNDSKYSSLIYDNKKNGRIFWCFESQPNIEDLTQGSKLRAFKTKSFELNNYGYYLSKEWENKTGATLDIKIFIEIFNSVYSNYQIIEDGDYYVLRSNNQQSLISNFYKNTQKAGLIFSSQLIQRFVASLCTKPFVICSGLSGSGKTKLAQAFAQWISADKLQYEIVPVGADWTNREPLLGYPNALDREDYVSPENGVLNLLIRARNEYDIYLADETKIPKPYFLILDEMNLSHVERYFADFLSTMESGDAIPLHKIVSVPDEEKIDIPQSLKLPKNLFIIGTVNIDETTYMFSPKVLDRANTIEFRLTTEDLEKYIASDIKLNMELLKAQGANMSDSFMAMALQETDKNLKPSEVDLKIFFSELKKSGAEFGYRTASEIGRLMYILKELGESDDSLLDIAIMQKLLPKLHGSRNKLTKVLPILGGFCLSDNSKIKEDYLDPFLTNSLTEVELKADSNVKYKISFEKICRMYKNAVENGFASYAEA